MAKLSRKEEEEEEKRIAYEISQNGTRIGLSWYEYEGEFYQILHGTKIGYSKQKRLKINPHEGWYILDINNANACMVYIDGFEKVLNGIDPDSIIIYPDKYFSFRQGKVTELWRFDLRILLADDIIRLSKDLWSLKSNDVYYITNLNNRMTRPIGKYQPYVDEMGIYFIDENNNRQNINYDKLI